MSASRRGAHQLREVTLRGDDPQVRAHRVHALHVAGSGNGPPVVLVHGLAASHLNWVPLAPLLAEGLGASEVWAPDLSGCGRTPPLATGTGLDSNCRLLRAFVDTVLGAQPVLLVGSSMGGLICLLYASSRPSSIAGTVLIGPATPVPLRRIHDREVAKQLLLTSTPVLGRRLLDKVAATTTASQQLREQFKLSGVDLDGLEAEVREALLAMADERRPLAHRHPSLIQATRSVLRAIVLHRSAAWRAIDAVPDPVLVLHGEKDRLLAAAQSQALVQRRPTWSLRTYAGLGHLPMLEKPESVADDIVDWFMREHAAGSAKA